MTEPEATEIHKKLLHPDAMPSKIGPCQARLRAAKKSIKDLYAAKGVEAPTGPDDIITKVDKALSAGQVLLVAASVARVIYGMQKASAKEVDDATTSVHNLVEDLGIPPSEMPGAMASLLANL